MEFHCAKKVVGFLPNHNAFMLIVVNFASKPFVSLISALIVMNYPNEYKILHI